MSHLVGKRFPTFVMVTLAMLLAAPVAGATAYIVVLKPGVNADSDIKLNGLLPKNVYRFALNGYPVDLNAKQYEKVNADANVNYVVLDDHVTGLGPVQGGAPTKKVGRSRALR